MEMKKDMNKKERLEYGQALISELLDLLTIADAEAPEKEERKTINEMEQEVIKRYLVTAFVESEEVKYLDKKLHICSEFSLILLEKFIIVQDLAIELLCCTMPKTKACQLINEWLEPHKLTPEQKQTILREYLEIGEDS